jgi:hypothetical protein
MALHRLAAEGHRQAGGPAGGAAHDGAEGIDPRGAGELAGDLQVGRRVGRRGDEGVGGQDGVTGQRRGEFRIGEGGGRGHQAGEQNESAHGNSSRVGDAALLPTLRDAAPTA